MENPKKRKIRLTENDTVKCKLTDYGAEVFNKAEDVLMKLIGPDTTVKRHIYHPKEIVNSQLWSVIEKIVDSKCKYGLGQSKLLFEWFEVESDD